MRRRYAALLVVTTLAIGACAGSSAEAEPGGPEDVLIRIEDIGGFIPFEMTLAQGPTFTLTTDGKLLSVGAVNAIYPGPLVWPYFVAQLTPGEVSQIQNMIGRIGLPDMDDVVEDTASGMIADAGSTLITYWDSKGTHKFTVYALGIHDQASDAAKTLDELRTILMDLSGQKDPQEYQPKRIRVIAGEGMQFIDEDFLTVEPWPLPDTTPSSWKQIEQGWTCMGFDGQFLAPFLAANQTTLWTNPEGGPDLTLYVRSLHPGEEDCP